jgi:hypothetical protein
MWCGEHSLLAYQGAFCVHPLIISISGPQLCCCMNRMGICLLRQPVSLNTLANPTSSTSRLRLTTAWPMCTRSDSLSQTTKGSCIR